MMMVANAYVKAHGVADEGVDRGQPLLELQVGSLLDPGVKRKDRPNEDSLFVAQALPCSSSALAKPLSLFMVADGMGGHTNGQEASHLAIASLVEYVYASLRSKQMTSATLLPLLMEGVQQANLAVYQRNQERGTMMGTMMTASLLSGTTAYVVNVGDSRTYLYRASAGLSQITHDHSLVAALVEAGVIKPDDIYTHPLRNQIYRSLGEKAVLTVDTFVVPLAAGDTLLLCSDGLWEMVHDPHIESILATTTSQKRKIALITGASSGIGAAFARTLAAEQYDLVLVARRKERLRSLATELHEQFHVNVEVLVADLSRPGDVEHIEQRIGEVDTLDILVNNAGFGIPGTFVENPLERYLEMIAVHVLASVRLCHAALPGMIARGQGAIINVSSIGAFMTGSGDETYCATKAFLNVFSEALQAELVGTGVRVQALCPGFTDTEFHDQSVYEPYHLKAKIPESAVDVSGRGGRKPRQRMPALPTF